MYNVWRSLRAQAMHEFITLCLKSMARSKLPQCFGRSLRLPSALDRLKSDHEAQENLSSPKEQR